MAVGQGLWEELKASVACPPPRGRLGFPPPRRHDNTWDVGSERGLHRTEQRGGNGPSAGPHGTAGLHALFSSTAPAPPRSARRPALVLPQCGRDGPVSPLPSFCHGGRSQGVWKFECLLTSVVPSQDGAESSCYVVWSHVPCLLSSSPSHMPRKRKNNKQIPK